MSYPSIIPIRTKEDLSKVIAAAKDDNHTPLFPTHGVVKEGSIIGAFSAFAVPFAWYWASTEKCTPRDSAFLLSYCMGMARDRSAPGIIVSFREKSNYEKAIQEHFDFTSMDHKLYIKDLTKDEL